MPQAPGVKCGGEANSSRVGIHHNEQGMHFQNKKLKSSDIIKCACSLWSGRHYSSVSLYIK